MNKDIKAKEVFYNMGIEENTIQFMDYRTEMLIKSYKFYKYNPQIFDSEIWFESYIIIDEAFQPKGIF